MSCLYRRGSECLVASSLLADQHRVNLCTDEACETCLNSDDPKTKNNVTYSLAITFCLRNCPELAQPLIKEHKKYLGINEDPLEKIRKGNGVGSQCWKLLESLGIEHKVNCPCIRMAIVMNQWGPEGCRENKEVIVEHFQKYYKNYGWAECIKAATKSVTTGLVFKLNPLDPFGSIVEESIKRAEQAK